MTRSNSMDTSRMLDLRSGQDEFWRTNGGGGQTKRVWSEILCGGSGEARHKGAERAWIIPGVQPSRHGNDGNTGIHSDIKDYLIPKLRDLNLDRVFVSIGNRAPCLWIDANYEYDREQKASEILMEFKRTYREAVFIYEFIDNRWEYDGYTQSPIRVI